MDWSQCDPLVVARNTIAGAVRHFDAQAVSVARAVELVDLFAEVERVAAAGKALAAGAAGLTADAMAARTRSSAAAARSALEVASGLRRAPQTDASFRAGRLSVAQAAAITGAVAVDPSAEARLLDMAGHVGLQKLRDECARVRAAGADAPTRRRRIRAGRFWRRWTDADGARCGFYRTTPEDAAVIEAAAQPFIDAAFERARQRGEREPAEAHAVDGLVALARSTLEGEAAPNARGRGRRRLTRRRELIGIVDLASLRRGRVEPGETCEIPGVGPIPVEVARDVFGDALLRIVIRDGVDVRTVVHTGRTANAVQETAVFVRQHGRCLKPSCSAPIEEIDHTHGWSVTRVTTLDDLGGVCGRHHDDKTLRGCTYRRGERGWEWHDPDGTVEHERAPP